MQIKSKVEKKFGNQISLIENVMKSILEGLAERLKKSEIVEDNYKNMEVFNDEILNKIISKSL